MPERIVAYMGLPISQADPTVSWRLLVDDQFSPEAGNVIRDVIQKQTQSTHGSEQILIAIIPGLSEAPARVDGASASSLLDQMGGRLYESPPVKAAHLLSRKMATLPRDSSLRRIYAARVRMACPGHMGGPMVEPPGLMPATDPAFACGTCMHFCPSRSICKMYGDYPVTFDLVCPSWQG